MRFFQVPARKWWWALVALAAYVGFFVVIQLMSVFAMLVSDPSMIQDVLSGGLKTTPSLFLINNLALAAEILTCTLIAWLFFRQGFGWLVSVVGRFRWKWFLITIGVFAAGYAVQTVVELLVLTPEEFGFAELEMKPYTWFMIGAILLTTPLQAAGEEFQSRALLARLIAAIVPFRWVGLALSALIPSLFFMLLHNASDVWLNIDYFCTALLLWWLAYRTGGIEASIALHVINNLFALMLLPFSDISDMFDRGEGTGSPMILIYLAAEFVLVLLIDYIARRRGLVRLSAPASSTPQVVKPRTWFTRIVESTEPATEADLPRLATRSA